MYEDRPIYIYRLNRYVDKVRSLNFCEKEDQTKNINFKIKNNLLIEIGYTENKKLLYYVPK